MSEQSDFLRENYEAAQVQADLAKLDLIVAQYRSDFDDARLNLLDIAGIRQSARAFMVHERAAYWRAHGLKMLSYQRAEATHDNP